MATQTQMDNFINNIAGLIQTECQVRGWGVPSAIIAQAICESNWGLSGLAKYNNLFGMKCGSSWKGKSVNMTTKEEYTVGTLTTIKDNFRVYDSLSEGIDGYFQFLSTTRYAPVRAAKDYKTYINALKNAGYATSSTYVNTLCRIVDNYNLQRFDSAVAITASTAIKPVYKVGCTYKITVKLNIRTAPLTEADVVKQYKVDDTVVCKEIITMNNIPWIRTNLGWICTQNNGKYYVIGG